MAQVSNMANNLSPPKFTAHGTKSTPSASSSSFVASRRVKTPSKCSWVLGNKSAFNAEKKKGCLRISASVAAAEKPSTVPEIELQPIKEISGLVKLPGSKSLSNRILLLAALSEGTTVVDNLLSSDDIHYMLGALKTLGLRVEEDKGNQRATVEGGGGQFPASKESKE